MKAFASGLPALGLLSAQAAEANAVVCGAVVTHPPHGYGYYHRPYGSYGRPYCYR